MNILVVDDDQICCKIVEKAFSNNGNNIVFANDQKTSRKDLIYNAFLDCLILNNITCSHFVTIKIITFGHNLVEFKILCHHHYG